MLPIMGWSPLVASSHSLRGGAFGALPRIVRVRPLPDYQEPLYAAADFNVDGYDDHRIPDMNNRVFWSVSVHPQNNDQAFVFFGDDGSVDGGSRDLNGSVRCVR